MPNEPLAGLNTPNTGDLVGAWGTTAVNANMQAVGGMFGGTLNISLSGATTITLTGPSGLTPGAGPTQQQNFLLTFNGAQTGNAVVLFSRPRHLPHQQQVHRHDRLCTARSRDWDRKLYWCCARKIDPGLF